MKIKNKIHLKLNKKEPWYKKEFKKFFKEKKEELILSLIIILIISLWYIFKDNTFTLMKYTLIEDIPLNRGILSMLTYMTIGSLLYCIGFYLLLYKFFVQVLGSYKLYIRVKAIIWGILMIIMYLYIGPFIISVINTIATIFINIFNFIAYIFLPAGIILIFILVYLILKHYKKI